ncbi:MAG: hypothetical protein PHH36_05565 [Sideroxydans sp.]|nr:hypothetical protein [Sideroxydans sp.]
MLASQYTLNLPDVFRPYQFGNFLDRNAFLDQLANTPHLVDG